jgi:hypothetical protein
MRIVAPKNFFAELKRRNVIRGGTLSRRPFVEKFPRTVTGLDSYAFVEIVSAIITSYLSCRVAQRSQHFINVFFGENFIAIGL